MLAAVRTLNRMEFVGETLRAALEALAAAAPGWLAPLTGSSWADRYGARIDSYRFPQGENARERWAGQAGRDGFALLDAVGAPQAPGWLGQIPAVEALRRAWDQQYHRDGTGVRWREDKRPPAGRTAAGLPLRPGRPLRRQARIRLDGLQGAPDRDLRAGHAPGDHERGDHRRDHR